MQKSKYLLPVVIIFLVTVAYQYGGSFAALGGTTPIPTLTLSPEPTLTHTPTPIVSITPTPAPTATVTATPTATVTATPVMIPTLTATPTPTATPPVGTSPQLCDRIHSAADFPQTNTYAPPYNVVTGTGENMIKITCDSDVNVTVEAGTASPTEYVYDSGYVYRDNQWAQIALNRPNANVQKIEGHWFDTVATTTFAMPAGKLNSESFFLAFVCHWSDSKWKCGCADDVCASPKWNLQVFQRK